MMNRKFISYCRRIGAREKFSRSSLCVFSINSRSIFLSVFLLSALFFSLKSEAGPRDEIMPLFTGARMLAMGGAQVAVVSDETALLANPAGLGRVRDSYGTIFDPELDFGQNLSAIYKTKAFTNPLDLQQVSNTLTETPDTYFYQRDQLFPSFVIRNFGIGFYWRQLMAAQMNSTATSMDVRSYDDMVLALGYNLRIWEGRIKIGFVGKAISRIEINRSIAPTSSLDRKDYATEGVGFGGDVALNLAAPWTFIPTLAIVARDVGGTKFSGGKNLRMVTTDLPTELTQDYDVGVAVFPILTNHTRSSFTYEYQRIREAALAQDKLRYSHAGYELNLYDTLFLRVGLNQRYVTGGLELASEHFQFQLSTYGQDVGTDGSPKEDRRVVVKFSLRF